MNEQEIRSYTKNLHQIFIDTMHPHFDVQNPTYVNNIQFRPLLVYAIYGVNKITGESAIYLSKSYLEKINKNQKVERTDLDLSVFHESAHHLHYLRQKTIFQDRWILEPIIDCAVLYYLQKNKMGEHINLHKTYEPVAFELYDKLQNDAGLKSFLVAPEPEAIQMLEQMLGENHWYLKEGLEKDQE